METLYTGKLEKYKIAETYIKLNLDYGSDKKETIGRILRLIAEKQVREFKYNEGIEIALEIEKGSVKMKILIYGTVFISLISEYGSIRQGLTQICNDVKWISENIIGNVKQDNRDIDRIILRTEKRTGIVGRLKRTIDKIEKLQIELNDKSNTQLKAELSQMKQDLANILELLDETEQHGIINSLSDEILKDMPKPNNEGMKHIYNMYAIKPEETRFLPF